MVAACRMLSPALLLASRHPSSGGRVGRGGGGEWWWRRVEAALVWPPSRAQWRAERPAKSLSPTEAPCLGRCALPPT